MQWVNPMDNHGFIGPTVRTVFSDMKDVPEFSKDFQNCRKFVQRCLLLKEEGEFEKEGNTSKKHFRVSGAGAPIRAIEARQELFDFFIDVRTASQGQLPRRVFLAKIRIVDLLKNAWTSRHYFIKHYDVDYRFRSDAIAPQ